MTTDTKSDMRTIAYVGTSDFQEFSKADFEKAGIEDAKSVRFARFEPTEVSAEIAEVLVNRNDTVFDDFLFEDLTEVGEDAETNAEQLVEQGVEAEKAGKKAEKKAAKASDSSSPETAGKAAKTQGASPDGTGGPTSTGAGSSTGGPTS